MPRDGEEKGTPEKTPRGLKRLLGEEGRPRAGSGGSGAEPLPGKQVRSGLLLPGASGWGGSRDVA